MRATAVVPVKRFSAAKTRLAAALSPEARSLLAEAMLVDVLAELGRSEALEATIVVSGEPLAIRAARAAGVAVLEDPDDAGHSAAAARGVREALTRGAECVALLPGDCPLLQAAELDDRLDGLRAPAVAVIADRHGSGTNGLLLGPPDAIEPAFGPGSRERHLKLAREAGVKAEVVAFPSLALDLDTAEDLRELIRVLEAEPELAPRTAGALACGGRDAG